MIMTLEWLYSFHTKIDKVQAQVRMTNRHHYIFKDKKKPVQANSYNQLTGKYTR